MGELFNSHHCQTPKQAYIIMLEQILHISADIIPQVTLVVIQLNLVPKYNIIFMSGAHGVAGWVWGGGGWVSVDRRLFHIVASGWLWSCRVWQHC